MSTPLSTPSLIACADTRGPAQQYPVVVLLGAAIAGSGDELCLNEADLAALQEEFAKAKELLSNPPTS